MVYCEEKIINGKEYYYLVENIRIGKKWKKIRHYIGKGKKTKKELDILKKKYSKEIKKKVDNYLRSVDSLKDVLTKKQEENLEKIKEEYNRISKKMTNIQKQNYYDWFLTEFTYDTNAIEGSTVTLRETALILFEDFIPAGKSLKEVHEVENHKEAFDFVSKYKNDLDKKFVCEIHRKLMYNILDKKNAGVFRKVQVFITGSEFLPPKPKEIENEFKDLLKWYKNNKNRYNPIVVASYAHTGFEIIHPFVDGNGRVGRLLLNFILVKNGFPAINIKNKNKQKYYETLQKAQKGDLKPFVNLVYKYIKENELLKK